MKAAHALGLMAQRNEHSGRWARGFAAEIRDAALQTNPGPNPRDGALRWKAAGWRAAVRMQQRIRIRWELDRV